MRLALVLVLTALLLLPACNKPRLGGKCEPGQAVCSSAQSVLACARGTFVSVACKGPAGCTNASGQVSCDDSTAEPGDACLTSDGQNRACGGDGKTSLLCEDGTFKAVQTCGGANGCTIKGDAIACDTSRAQKGDLCVTTGAYACTPDVKSRVVCKDGMFVFDRFCKGAAGCHPGDAECDATIADVGDPCTLSGMRACATDGTTELLCQGGQYFADRTCKDACRVSGQKITCR